MKKYFIIFIAVITIVFNSCTNGQTNGTKTNLSVTEFAQKIKELPNAPIVDVRTPDEFSKGHLPNSFNYDWNGSEFEKQIAPLDKSQPVFVYCLSGGRSASAANKMRSKGFTQVFEMDGGMMKWRGANLPETKDNGALTTGMTQEQFDTLLNDDKLVLIDYYADWCAPCKKMEPYLNEISRDMAEEVVVIRINADDNQALCKALKITTLPVLQLYKNKALIWNHTGFIEKEAVVKQLK